MTTVYLCWPPYQAKHFFQRFFFTILLILKLTLSDNFQCIDMKSFVRIDSIVDILSKECFDWFLSTRSPLPTYINLILYRERLCPMLWKLLQERKEIQVRFLNVNKTLGKIIIKYCIFCFRLFKTIHVYV